MLNLINSCTKYVFNISSTNHVSIVTDTALKTYYELFDLACLKTVNDYHETIRYFDKLLSQNKGLSEQEKEYCKLRVARKIETRKERDKSSKPITCEYCNSTRYSERYCENCIREHLRGEFNKWSSGDETVDKFIQNNQLQSSVPPFILEWIPFENDQFENITYLTDGGFSKIHCAKWKRGPIMDWDEKKQEFIYEGTIDVALKSLNVSSEKFYDEVNNYFKIRSGNLIKCYGITKLPGSNDYVMASDIYSLGMLMWEVFAEHPPFHDQPHNVDLALEIVGGKRPPMLSNKIPDVFQQLILKCWKKDAKERPEIEEILRDITESSQEISKSYPTCRTSTSGLLSIGDMENFKINSHFIATRSLSHSYGRENNSRKALYINETDKSSESKYLPFVSFIYSYLILVYNAKKSMKIVIRRWNQLKELIFKAFHAVGLLLTKNFNC
ncbi:kinase-like domain-containing protein [Rhizophagus clarus]|uniref:Kinase-like domain-containing protein n=1 Tax=Rhizophagus clarus TaxID=94130 RepID=A0A8H3LTJ7_9GLOM|nr:kinase-like domain-containing protein [Rhizophagus clarus]